MVMNAFDSFLSKSFAEIIKKNLGLRTYEKIEEIIREQYNVTVEQSISDFRKIYAVLVELFASGADVIIQDWIDCLISYDKDDKSIMFKDQVLAELILKSFGNMDKKIILQTANYSDIIPNIIKRAKIPRSSGYRLSKELIKDGLLVKDGNIKTNDGKIISKYVSLFDDVRIDVLPIETVARVKMKKEHINNSNMLQTIIQ